MNRSTIVALAVAAMSLVALMSCASTTGPVKSGSTTEASGSVGLRWQDDLRISAEVCDISDLVNQELNRVHPGLFSVASDTEVNTMWTIEESMGLGLWASHWSASGRHEIARLYLLAKLEFAGPDNCEVSGSSRSDGTHSAGRMRVSIRSVGELRWYDEPTESQRRDFAAFKERLDSLVTDPMLRSDVWTTMFPTYHCFLGQAVGGAWPLPGVPTDRCYFSEGSDEDRRVYELMPSGEWRKFGGFNQAFDDFLGETHGLRPSGTKFSVSGIGALSDGCFGCVLGTEYWDKDLLAHLVERESSRSGGVEGMQEPSEISVFVVCSVAGEHVKIESANAIGLSRWTRPRRSFGVIQMSDAAVAICSPEQELLCLHRHPDPGGHEWRIQTFERNPRFLGSVTRRVLELRYNWMSLEFAPEFHKSWYSNRPADPKELGIGRFFYGRASQQNTSVSLTNGVLFLGGTHPEVSVVWRGTSESPDLGACLDLGSVPGNLGYNEFHGLGSFACCMGLVGCTLDEHQGALVFGRREASSRRPELKASKLEPRLSSGCVLVIPALGLVRDVPMKLNQGARNASIGLEALTSHAWGSRIARSIRSGQEMIAWIPVKTQAGPYTGGRVWYLRLHKDKSAGG